MYANRFLSLIKSFGLAFFVVAFAPSVAAQMEIPEASDVRVLIDISGSMKKNDPNNLRRPALNLITELLPAGNSAGVWTFGQYVNQLVPPGKATPSWRRLAREKSSEISSVALFTNIGAALEEAASDLEAGQEYSNTHFILLTDGVVDISKTPGANVTERERILTEVIPRFEALGAKVHSIALSDNADLNLLKSMSVATDGIYALAESSEDLSKVFLQALQTAAPAEEVPIENNEFEIDSSIEEFTALIFRNEESSQTSLVEPSGETFNYENRPDYVRWYREVGYDLITVKRPFEGTWKLDADLAPGSRVTVVSNLKMLMDPLPTNFYAGDQLEIRIGFFEDGEQITNPSFLGLVAVDVTVQTEQGKSGTKRISEDGAPPADGVFREDINKLKETGRYQVTAVGDGRTFRRQVRQVITLNAPMAAELQATGTGDDTRYRVVVNALSENIDTAETAVISKIKSPDGSNLIKSVPYNEQTGRWELEIEPARGEGIYELDLRIDGKSLNGNSFRVEPELLQAEFPRQEASPNEYRSLVDGDSATAMNEALASEPVQPAVTTEPQGQPEAIAPPISEEMAQQAAAEQAAAAEEEEKPGSSTRTTLYIVGAVGAGLVVLSLIGLGIWTWRRKKADQAALEKRTHSDSKEPRTLRPEEDADELAAAAAAVEMDLEDEIEQLENPEELIMDVTEPELPGESEEEKLALDETDEMEFSLDEEETPAEQPAEPEPVAEEIAEMAEEGEGEPESSEEVETADIGQDDIDDLLGGSAEESSEETVDEQEKTAEEIADEILESNQAQDDDDEFNLEDFDISDTDDLPGGDEDDDKK